MIYRSLELNSVTNAIFNFQSQVDAIPVISFECSGGSMASVSRGARRQDVNIRLRPKRNSAAGSTIQIFIE